MSEIVLKGGISNVYYVWCADDGACDACQSLDGTEYEFPEDIPDRPHPNCRCYVEMVERENTNSSKDDFEPCDCWDKIDKILEEAEKRIAVYN